MKPEVNRYYKHKHGGIYRVIEIAESAVDNTGWVVYNHCYPFGYKAWVRPLEEWTKERFTILTNDQYHIELDRDRTLFQDEVKRNKLLHKES
jgi:hypothetical protein